MVFDSPSLAAGTLTRTVPTALIAFDFDPLLHLGDGAVRWETIGVAAAIFVALVVAGLTVRSLGLRVDDLLFVVLGIVPGAVVGGRLGYVFLYPAWFGSDPGRIVDPGVGSLELTLAVVGGALTGAIVAILLDGQPGRWLHAATLPTLLALAGGKLATLLGGRGQGQPWDGDWATAYLGPGPWGSLAPQVPSHPSQVYEALVTIAILVIVMGLLRIRAVRRPDGRAFLIAIAAWAVGRALVATTWRDPVASGPFRLEQVIDVAVAAGAIVLVALLLVRQRRAKVAESDEDGVRAEPPGR
ncbi:MAG: phosphatidylglycerol---prolipoprotein diacylglyceryl transferase [Chloroflexota bacterium]|jgi:phosphatidylglycerol:prolipoprotein diacylglycerol transferase|nr:phosphatidylglycerol---prolipoprotein diacylglyceryl transferase [Chloroflexota bacterium]